MDLLNTVKDATQCSQPLLPALALLCMAEPPPGASQPFASQGQPSHSSLLIHFPYISWILSWLCCALLFLVPSRLICQPPQLSKMPLSCLWLLKKPQKNSISHLLPCFTANHHTRYVLATPKNHPTFFPPEIVPKPEAVSLPSYRARCRHNRHYQKLCYFTLNTILGNSNVFIYVRWMIHVSIMNFVPLIV